MKRSAPDVEDAKRLYFEASKISNTKLSSSDILALANYYPNRRDILDALSAGLLDKSEINTLINEAQVASIKGVSKTADGPSSQSNHNLNTMAEIGSRTVTMDDGTSPMEMSTQTSRSDYTKSWAKDYDNEGHVLPSVRWFPAGDKRNRDIMVRLKKEQPILYKSMIYRKWDKKNFPGLQYGKAYFKRGVPGSWTMNTFGKSWAEANESQKAARKQYGFRGYGSYWGRQLGGMAGRAIGSRFGLARPAGQIGARLGDYASDYIDRSLGFSGSGSYDAPNIMSNESVGNLGSINPQSVNSLINNASRTRYLGSMLDETNSIVITHTEYIKDISASTSAFETPAFLSINPGLAQTFPWLSNIAQFYEEYQFEQLVFSFKSMVPEGNASASGTVIMATQYNPANGKFTSKQQMENYDFSQSCKVTADAIHAVECDENKRGGPAIEYVRTSAVPAGQDVKTFDMGTFQLSISGGFNYLTVGELWVSYKVRLGKSKIAIPGSVGRQNIGFLNASITSASAASPLGSSAPVVTQALENDTINTANKTNLTDIVLTTTGFTFPTTVSTGTYLVILQYTSGTAATVKPTMTASGAAVNCVVTEVSVGDVGAVPDTFIYSVVVNAPAANTATVDFGKGGLTSLASASGSLRIMQVFSQV